MVPVLLLLALVFAALFLTRLGGIYRDELTRRWPAVLLAGAAIFCLMRGQVWPAATFASLAILAWVVWPRMSQRRSPAQPPQVTPEDLAARAVLGVGPNATPDEIRRAYRAKMARAHPDRGGTHNEAARLTAARDRLLNKKR